MDSLTKKKKKTKKMKKKKKKKSLREKVISEQGKDPKKNRDRKIVEQI